MDPAELPPASIWRERSVRILARLSVRPTDWALSGEPQRLRGSLEAPKPPCSTLPEVHWNALWLVSRSSLLGSGTA